MTAAKRAVFYKDRAASLLPRVRGEAKLRTTRLECRNGCSGQQQLAFLKEGTARVLAPIMDKYKYQDISAVSVLHARGV